MTDAVPFVAFLEGAPLMGLGTFPGVVAILPACSSQPQRDHQPNHVRVDWGGPAVLVRAEFSQAMVEGMAAGTWTTQSSECYGSGRSGRSARHRIGPKLVDR